MARLWRSPLLLTTSTLGLGPGSGSPNSYLTSSSTILSSHPAAASNENHIRSLFLCGFGRKLLQPKKSNLLNNDATPVVLGSGQKGQGHKKEVLNKLLWNTDFIEYQNIMQINVLKDLMGITIIKAAAIVQKYPLFNFTDSELIKESYHYLVSKGVSTERILKMPTLLALKTSLIEEKAKQIMSLLKITSFSTAAAFLEIPTNRLNHLSKLWTNELAKMKVQFPNRLEYLASLLECEPCLIADMMIKVPVLMSGTLSITTTKIQVLLDAGIKSEDIIKDPYVFTQNVHALQERMELCREKGLDVIKPWMLRATSQALEEYVTRLHHETALLAPHNNEISGFLQDSLNCDQSTVDQLLHRVPALKSASASKLDAMIQFLYTAGFNSENIINAPSVLAHSQSKIAKRITELTAAGFKSDILIHILCQSSKRYQQFVVKSKRPGAGAGGAGEDPLLVKNGEHRLK